MFLGLFNESIGRGVLKLKVPWRGWVMIEFVLVTDFLNRRCNNFLFGFVCICMYGGCDIVWGGLYKYVCVCVCMEVSVLVCMYVCVGVNVYISLFVCV